MLKKYHYTAFIMLVLGGVLAVLAARDFLSMHKKYEIHPSEFLTGKGRLSDYLDNLHGTNGDTDIYYYDSGKPGATVLLLGGTHPNEPSGYIAAVLLAENAKVEEGRLIVIPQACHSGFTCTDPMEALPLGYTLETRHGDRYFSFGSRISNPLDQWPDPEVYSHYPSGQQLSGFETRNLNRNYPGRPDGTLTEKVGYAIIQLIKEENVDVAFDLHEAAPEIPIINAIVCHEKANDIAGMAILNLAFEDLHYALEISPQNFRGLSHREWGDATDVVPFLMETSNPIQGRLRGPTDAELLVTGKDENYRIALESGKLRIEYTPGGEPLLKRTARQIQGFIELINAYNDQGEKKLIFENIPGYNDLMEKGFKQYLY